MTVPTIGLMAAIEAKGALSATDALAVRRLAWPDGRIDPAEADAIFDLNASVRDASSEWVDLFVEAIVEYVVNQQEPRGYVDEAKAAWLIDRIDRDGRIDTLGELELLVKLLESATSVPDRLRAYALAQIETVVLSGHGPTRRGGAVDPGSITASEVALLRRMIFAGGGDGPARVSSAEADMLFRLKDAMIGRDNDAGWTQLFVQGVGNHLMAHAGFIQPSRDEALRLDAAMNDTESGVLGFLSRMGDFRDGWRAPSGTSSHWDEREDQVMVDAAITPVEDAWLSTRVDGDGRHDALETALLTFIAEERAR